MEYLERAMYRNNRNNTCIKQLTRVNTYVILRKE